MPAINHHLYNFCLGEYEVVSLSVWLALLTSGVVLFLNRFWNTCFPCLRWGGGGILYPLIWTGVLGGFVFYYVSVLFVLFLWVVKMTVLTNTYFACICFLQNVLQCFILWGECVSHLGVDMGLRYCTPVNFFSNFSLMSQVYNFMKYPWPKLGSQKFL